MAFTPFVETDQPTMAEFNEKFQECIVAALEQGLQIETGSYDGTGTSGSGSPNVLTFSFVPKIWSVYTRMQYGNSPQPIMFGLGSTGSYSTFMLLPWIEGKTLSVQLSSGATISMSGTTASWYSSNADGQLNETNCTYYYVAIGKGEST